MSLWKAITGFFSSPSADGAATVREMATGVGRWIDEQQFTPEEKAEYNAVLVKDYLSFVAATASENTERSRTRRAIALLVIRWWLAMATFAIFLWPINTDWAKFVFSVIFDPLLGGLILGIAAFFFGVHILRAAQR